LVEDDEFEGGVMTATVSTAIVSKLRVFLSYRTVEARFADVLKEHLIRDFIGLVEVFLASDTTSVAAGKLWLDEIVEGLRHSQLHIVVCSKGSVERPWINYEVGASGVRGIPVIPLCHSGLVPGQLPVPLSQSEGGVLTDAASLLKVYLRVAELIGSAVPQVDFDAFAAEFADIEKQTTALSRIEDACLNKAGLMSSLDAEHIENPHVVCVTSPQFRDLGYENQLQMVIDAFPKRIRHQFILTSAELRSVLFEQRVDIVHIAAFVCPRGGDLYFSPVELPQGSPAPGEIDRVSAVALAALIAKACTRLVVLGASASLVLGAQLLPVTNVIAAGDLVSPAAMALWVEMFYKSLASDSISTAFKLASEVSQAPMQLYARQGPLPG
jgi:hypothetical protein